MDYLIMGGAIGLVMVLVFYLITGTAKWVWYMDDNISTWRSQGHWELRIGFAGGKDMDFKDED